MVFLYWKGKYMSEESFGKSDIQPVYLPVFLKDETDLDCILWHNYETVKTLDKNSDFISPSVCMHADVYVPY